MLQPPNPGSFVCFSLTCSRGGGGSTAAAVTLDTVAAESRKKMADGVARSRLGFVAETARFVAMETPGVRFSCMLAFVPCFLLCVLFVLYFFSASRYVYLRVPSSVQQPSANLREDVLRTEYVTVRVLFACVTCNLPHLGILSFLFV